MQLRIRRCSVCGEIGHYKCSQNELSKLTGLSATKVCSKCKEEKPLTLKFWHRNRYAIDGVLAYCKECRTKLTIQKRDDQNSYKKNLRAKRYIAINLYKARRGCIECGEDRPDKLQFHHIDPNTKSFTVSTGILRKFKDLEDEIEKCWVVCQVCHKKITYKY